MSAEEGRTSRGSRPLTSRGLFACSLNGSYKVVGSGGSRASKRKATEDDISWLVCDSRQGDGSVIPSYGGHIAPHIWAGEHKRNMLKCHNREKTSKKL